MLVAAAATHEEVYADNNYTFGTTAPSLLYVEAAFRSLSTFGAKRVAVLRDKNEPMCFLDTVSAVSAGSPVELYGYYDLDPTAPDYQEHIRGVLVDLKENGVESVMGCSYLDLCIQVSAKDSNTQWEAARQTSYRLLYCYLFVEHSLSYHVYCHVMCIFMSCVLSCHAYCHVMWSSLL